MTLVSADLVFADDRWQARHGFVMQGGRILATGSPADLILDFPDHEREDWGEVAVLPGTINGHGHSFQALLRGFGDDLPFMAWRDRVLYPLSQELEGRRRTRDRKSTRLNSSHLVISYAVFCLKKKK